MARSSSRIWLTAPGWHGCSTKPLRPYTRELEGRLYSTLSKKPGSLKVSGWRCAVCQEAPASVIDRCHEHGCARAPVCQACNTHERRTTSIATTSTSPTATRPSSTLTRRTGSRHWHRRPGSRARTTFPLPHLVALTAQRLTRRKATRLRRRSVEEAQHHRTSDQPAQGATRSRTR
ncbi:endonuclease VII domain-containing protein [Actinacidiphila glaucinigra]|uniref:endonuclease domain-containing protein n=1 Tax=Actinacidiphila glaucinigra TaxID=235986 RepID=UPI002DDB32F2|nr:endonuclease domain-containing protein [Actinacidiphila glaucinigra]WSD65605.1 endonuclease VII domain-containing protein [Actinacidiphila glaucinigra]